MALLVLVFMINGSEVYKFGGLFDTKEECSYFADDHIKSGKVIRAYCEDAK